MGTTTTRSTDRQWERWGSEDPYYGVLSHESFRKSNLDDTARDEFFDSGRRHISHVLATCARHIDEQFLPTRSLDFGCGTGRLVIPLAVISDRVVGVDVSQSMLDEAKRNCDERFLENVEFVQSDDDLSGLHGSFDFVHSHIVFQHIPVDRGRALFARLLEHLESGGIGVVQFTYSKATFAAHDGVSSRAHKLLDRPVGMAKALIRRAIPRLSPGMQMNPYDLNQLFFMLQQLGVVDVHTEFTDHGGELGIALYFRKP